MGKVDWEAEKEFFNKVLGMDTKNYNTWVYRFVTGFLFNIKKTMDSEDF